MLGVSDELELVILFIFLLLLWSVKCQEVVKDAKEDFPKLTSGAKEPLYFWDTCDKQTVLQFSLGDRDVSFQASVQLFHAARH